MTIICKKRKILGREDNTGFLIKGGKVIPANYDIIDKANAELRKKCAKQKVNDAEASIAAHDMVAGGIYDDVANGPVLTKKRRF